MKRALIIFAVVLCLVAMIGFAALARADYVIAFHGPGCLPCMHMAPVEDALRAEGYDIRTVDASQRQDLAAYYKIHRWPQYVYVTSTPAGDRDSGARILGECTAGQLRRFSVIPHVVTLGAATRNAIKALVSPRWMFAPYHPQPLPGPVQ